MEESTTATNDGFVYRSILEGKTANNILDAQTYQLVTLCIIGLAIVFQPPALYKTKSRSLSFWVAILAVAASTPETTLAPILSTIIGTRTSYPYAVVIPHSFISAATYRSKHGDNVHYLRSFFLAFFLYGFGGSIVSDLLMGLPVTALSHSRIIPCYIIGWALVWACPFDIVYQKYKNSSSALHYFIRACEAIDSVTTPMGRISRSAREFPNKASVPIVAGLLAGIGGAGLRHFAGESNSIQVIENGFWKTLSYSLLWWWLAVRNCQDDTYNPFATTDMSERERLLLQEYNNCKSYGGSNMLRAIIVSSHTVWTILVCTGLASGHPLVWFCKNVLGKILVVFSGTFSMGLASEPVSDPVFNDTMNYLDANQSANAGRKKRRPTRRKKSKKKD